MPYPGPRSRRRADRYGERYGRDYDDTYEGGDSSPYVHGYPYNEQEVGNIDYDYEMRYGRSGMEQRAAPRPRRYEDEGEGYVPYPPGVPGNTHGAFLRRRRRPLYSPR